MEITTKAGDLVEEIAAASSEQAQGIEQINKAVAEMDKVVQQVAANAEESAGTSEEMRSQADQMHRIVLDLVGLVNGSSTDAAETAGSGPTSSELRRPKLGKASKPGMPSARAAAAFESEAAIPEPLIPLEGDDFSDF